MYPYNKDTFNFTDMNTLEKKEMPETIHHIKGAELPPNLQKKFKVEPDQLLTITINIETEEYDTDNVGDEIIKGLEELVHAKKNGVELQNIDDFLKTV